MREDSPEYGHITESMTLILNQGAMGDTQSPEISKVGVEEALPSVTDVM